jgi:hypothetical protein
VHRVRLILVAADDRPGEYVVIEAASRSVMFGPFHSDANPAIVAERIARRLGIDDRSIPVEWGLSGSDEA